MLREGFHTASTQFSQAIENGGTDMQLIELALEVFGHDPLVLSLDAAHLGLHQAASVVTAPDFEPDGR